MKTYPIIPCLAWIFLITWASTTVIARDPVESLRNLIVNDNSAAPDYEPVKEFVDKWESRGWILLGIHPQFDRKPGLPDSDFNLWFKTASPVFGNEQELSAMASEIYQDYIATVGPSVARQGFQPVEDRLSLHLSFLSDLGRVPKTLATPEHRPS